MNSTSNRRRETGAAGENERPASSGVIRLSLRVSDDAMGAVSWHYRLGIVGVGVVDVVNVGGIVGIVGVVIGEVEILSKNSIRFLMTFLLVF